jgi:hypothetical protein
MKITKIAFAVISLLGGASAFAAPVGKVLTLAGNVVAERNGQVQTLAIGATLENGDVLQVGPSSVAQIRFIDESIVSLRANTTFKVEDFRYNQTSEDRSVFGLVKGGMRTITGLIGKNNPKGYSVNGITATIGIRGTHFTVVSCDTAVPCKNADDSDANTGMYGGVTDGRIAVINDAGDFEFAQQEFFHVASRDSAPKRLLAPPIFLSSGFETAQRGRIQGNTTVELAGFDANRRHSLAGRQYFAAADLAGRAAISSPGSDDTELYVSRKPVFGIGGGIPANARKSDRLW